MSRLSPSPEALTFEGAASLLQRATAALEDLRAAVVERDTEAQLVRAEARMRVLREVQAAAEAGWPADVDGKLAASAASLHQAEAALESALQQTLGEVESELLGHRRQKRAASAYGGGQNLPARQRSAA